MKRSRLRYYILLSILIHILIFWLLRWLPPYEPTIQTPVAVRVLDVPTVSPPAPTRAVEPPAAEKRQDKKPEPKPPQRGGVLAELPKPQESARPDEARILSQDDSRAQDVGPGDQAAQKPSGRRPPELPPELALPERYSRQQPNEPNAAERPAPPPTPPQQQARVQPPAAAESTPKRRPETTSETQPEPSDPTPRPRDRDVPEEQRFHISSEQEVALLQRDREQQISEAKQQAMQEHLDRLERHLPLPSFDAPGTYDRGEEHLGEGSDDIGGGKFRSIDAFGLKHFSYLIGVKRKIELVFSVPYFAAQGRVGVPIVGFTIQRNGRLSEAVLLRSSGHGVVDQALLEAVKRAAPYYPFPSHLPDKEISIRVYATFS
jgi:protein TonB